MILRYALGFLSAAAIGLTVFVVQPSAQRDALLGSVTSPYVASVGFTDIIDIVQGSSSSAPCFDSGESCLTDTDNCCTGQTPPLSCQLSKTGVPELLCLPPPLCVGEGASCTVDADCCNNVCVGGTCDLFGVFTSSSSSSVSSMPDDTILEEYCGDDIENGEEECDDGNDNDKDACTNSCKIAYCGDFSVWEPGEECDDGPQETPSCNYAGRNNTKSCLPARCGDRYVNAAAGEQCDDGNLEGGDDCDGYCQWEACYSCASAGSDANACAARPNCVYNQNFFQWLIGTGTCGPDPVQCEILETDETDVRIVISTNPDENRGTVYIENASDEIARNVRVMIEASPQVSFDTNQTFTLMGVSCDVTPNRITCGEIPEMPANTDAFEVFNPTFTDTASCGRYPVMATIATSTPESDTSNNRDDVEFVRECEKPCCAVRLVDGVEEFRGCVMFTESVCNSLDSVWRDDLMQCPAEGATDNPCLKPDLGVYYNGSLANKEVTVAQDKGAATKVEVYNFGGARANIVSVSIEIPAGYAYNAAIPLTMGGEPAVCLPTPNRITCSAGVLLPSGMFDVTFNVKAVTQMSCGALTTATATVTSIDTDVDPSDNTNSTPYRFSCGVCCKMNAEEGDEDSCIQTSFSPLCTFPGDTWLPPGSICSQCPPRPPNPFSSSSSSQSSSSSSVNTTVPVDLAIEKVKVGTGPYNVGDEIPFDITVTNKGPGTAFNVSMRDEYEEQYFDYVRSITGFECDHYGSTVSCSVGELRPGGSTMIRLVFRLKARPTGDSSCIVGNLAFVSASNPEVQSNPPVTPNPYARDNYVNIPPFNAYCVEQQPQKYCCAVGATSCVQVRLTNGQCPSHKANTLSTGYDLTPAEFITCNTACAAPPPEKYCCSGTPTPTCDKKPIIDGRCPLPVYGQTNPGGYVASNCDGACVEKHPCCLRLERAASADTYLCEQASTEAECLAKKTTPPVRSVGGFDYTVAEVVYRANVSVDQCSASICRDFFRVTPTTCCAPDNSCTLLPRKDCEARQQPPGRKGNGDVCDAQACGTPPPPEPVVCCSTDPNPIPNRCTLALATECQGTAMPNLNACTPDPCPRPPQVPADLSIENVRLARPGGLLPEGERYPEEIVTYQVTVKNSGTQPATNVTVVDRFYAAAILDINTVPHENCVFGAGIITCPGLTVPANNAPLTLSFSFKVRKTPLVCTVPPSVGINEASVAASLDSPQSDMNSANNSKRADGFTIPCPGWTVTKTLAPDQDAVFARDERVKYILTFTRTGTNYVEGQDPSYNEYFADWMPNATFSVAAPCIALGGGDNQGIACPMQSVNKGVSFTKEVVVAIRENACAGAAVGLRPMVNTVRVKRGNIAAANTVSHQVMAGFDLRGNVDCREPSMRQAYCCVQTNTCVQETLATGVNCSTVEAGSVEFGYGTHDKCMKDCKDIDFKPTIVFAGTHRLGEAITFTASIKNIGSSYDPAIHRPAEVEIRGEGFHFTAMPAGLVGCTTTLSTEQGDTIRCRMPALVADAELPLRLTGISLPSSCGNGVKIQIVAPSPTSVGTSQGTAQIDCGVVVPVNACAQGCEIGRRVGGVLTCPTGEIVQQPRSWWARLTGWLTGSSLTAALMPVDSDGDGDTDENDSDCCCEGGTIPISIPVPIPVPSPLPTPTPSSSSTPSSPAPVPVPVPVPIPTPVPSSQRPVPVPPTRVQQCGLPCLPDAEGAEACVNQSRGKCEWKPSLFPSLQMLWGGEAGSCVRASSCPPLGGTTGTTSSSAPIGANQSNGTIVVQQSSSRTSSSSSFSSSDRMIAATSRTPFRWIVSGIEKQCKPGMVRTPAGECEPMPACPLLALSMTPSSLYAECAFSCAGFLDAAKCTAACTCSCRPGANPKAGQAAGSCVNGCLRTGGANGVCIASVGTAREGCCTDVCIGSACPSNNTFINPFEV